MGPDRANSGQGNGSKPAQPGKTSLRRILLVGDKPLFVALRQSLLRSGASKVLVAVSGAEGLKVARTVPPDAILLDAELPDLDGVEVCRRLRVDPLTEGIPVILLTGNSQTPSNRYSSEPNAVASVPMGIDTVRLLNMVQMVFNTPLTRRTVPRATVALGVDYTHDECTGTAKTLNLSQDGMFIVTKEPPEVGTHLVLHFALPDSDPVEGTARVAWIRGPGDEHPYPAGMAVTFMELPPEARPAIAAFVAHLLASPTLSKTA
jgi:uncharacterized protein (TIGR02266 family)